MAQLKTAPTGESVAEFIGGIENDQTRQACLVLAEMMAEVTGSPAEMWGTSIVGFGRYHYTYASGREGDWMITGFAPRKQALTLYIMAGFAEYDDLMARLGKHTTGKSCLYIKKLADVDLDVLRELVARSAVHMVGMNVASAEG